MKCGTIKKNAVFVVAKTVGKIRRIFNAEGKIVESALPGDPIEFTGYDSKENLPNPGMHFAILELTVQVMCSLLWSPKRKRRILPGSETEKNKKWKELRTN